MIVSDTESTMASEEFKKIYYLRTRSERVFSRLLSLEFQSSVNKGINILRICIESDCAATSYD